MKTTFIKITNSQRPSKYFYKVQDTFHKHPYIRKECLTCGKKSMQKTKSKGFCSRACAKIGDLNPTWKENSVYKKESPSQIVTWHKAVYSNRGQPSHCEHCKTTEDRMYHWANVSGNYEDILDYIRLCVPCHTRFDRSKDCQQKGGE